MVSHEICFLAEDLADELACANCARVSLNDRNDALNLIRRDTRADCAVACDRIGRSYHRVNAEVGVLKRAELTLEKNRLALLERVLNEVEGVGNIRSHSLLVFHELVEYLVNGDRILVIEVNERGVLYLENSFNLLPESVHIIVKLIDLEADLCEFIAVEGSNARFCRTEALRA